MDRDADGLYELSNDASLSAANECIGIAGHGEFLPNDGSIVSTPLDTGLLAIVGAANYTVLQHGVAGLKKTTALEYATKGVRVYGCTGVRVYGCTGVRDMPRLS
jgi:hypothetical protein